MNSNKFNFLKKIKNKHVPVKITTYYYINKINKYKIKIISTYIIFILYIIST